MAEFRPTKEWQVVPEGTILPPGLEIEADFATGLNRARLMPEPKKQTRKKTNSSNGQHHVEPEAEPPDEQGPTAYPAGFRLKPHNVEAEQALLGAILINNQAFREVSDYLRPAHFYEPIHSRIYAAMAALIDAGKLADPLTLKLQFDQDEGLRELDGAQYLARLARVAETIVNASEYGRLLHDLGVRRGLIEIGEALVNRAYDPRIEESAPQMLEEHRGMVEALREETAGPDAVHRLAYTDLARLSRPLPVERFLVDRWVPTGYLTSLYGSGGSGKSFLALMMAVAVATGRKWLGFDCQQGDVLCFMAEDDQDELLRRLAKICPAIGVELYELLGHLHIAPRIGKLNGLMSFPGGVPTPTPLYREVLDEAVRLKAKLVIVDNAAQTYGGSELDRGQVTAFCNGLVGIAQAIDGGVLMLGHPSSSTGREYSGSTAWNSVPRSRIWFESGESDGKYNLILKKANQSKKFGKTLQMNEKSGVVEPCGDIEPEPTATRKPGKRGPKSKADKTIALLEQLYQAHPREIPIGELIDAAIRRGIVNPAPDVKARGNREAVIRDHLNAFPDRVDFRSDDTVALKPV